MVGESLKSSAFSSQFLLLAMALEMVDISKWQALELYILGMSMFIPKRGDFFTTKSSWFIILGE